MANDYFADVPTIRYEGPDSDNELAYRFYDKNRVVLGKTMEEHLRFAACFWHGFCWPGSDVFGGGTFDRPWLRGANDSAAAAAKRAAAFDFFTRLDIPYYCFHDVDVMAEAQGVAEHRRLFAEAVDDLEALQASSGRKLLWGGREGYETLLNTDLKRELDNLGRFLSLVVEHKHKIGFTGTILIEPKPFEPTKHQYDFDTATVYGFLKRYGLENEVRVNIEANHATLASHSFEHEIATASALGIFGSIDANRGDPQNGWDTDQFPNSTEELTLAMLEIIRAGGFTTGGFNFDAKVRRQSIDAVDLFHGHIGGIDTVARGLLAAAAIIEDGRVDRIKADRYAGWDADFGKTVGSLDLAGIADLAGERAVDPRPRSGQQERLENLINRFIK